ncbi:MAG: hypothetical protein WBB74_08555 [Gaiellaceae bacterium]
MDAQARYEEIVDDLIHRNADVEAAKMMGMPAIKKAGKMVGGFWRDSMVFKLPDEMDRLAALTLEGAHLFDPSERNRPMKEWVVVPAAHAAEWARLAELALIRRAG